MTGTITATSLNLRAAPTLNGPIVGVLRSGTSVTILQQDGAWLRVSAEAGVGFLSAQFVKPDASGAVSAPSAAVPPPTAVPPRDDGTIRTDDEHAFTPDGLVFAYRSPRGFHTSGATSLSKYLAAAGTAIVGMPVSKLRVVQAVSLNE